MKRVTSREASVDAGSNAIFSNALLLVGEARSWATNLVEQLKHCEDHRVHCDKTLAETTFNLNDALLRIARLEQQSQMPGVLRQLQQQSNAEKKP